jgi:predicted nucleic acid-binding protein
MAIATAPPEIWLTLDTNILTAWRYSEPNIPHEVAVYQARHTRYHALTSTTVFEAIYGFEKGAKESSVDDETVKAGMEKTGLLIQSCEVLDFNSEAAVIAAYICGRLSKNISKDILKDVFIASTALAHSYGLVTRNRKDFELIGNFLPSSHPVLYLAAWKP